ncbi:MAG TPA: NUDIX hydrolase [Candidatus Kapabacteria bacterium]|nr:NUDIX hydrolase [Candidatus Kapabacteria bacterium]
MKIRNQARGIVINSRGEMLLVKHADTVPADPNEPERLEYWVAPGGGLEVGETYEEAAIREVFEETGLEVRGECRHIHTLEKLLMFGNELRMMHAQYYLIHHAEEPSEVRNADPGEGITDVRWWSYEECLQSNETFIPHGILDIFRDARAEFPPITREQI